MVHFNSQRFYPVFFVGAVKLMVESFTLSGIGWIVI